MQRRQRKSNHRLDDFFFSPSSFFKPNLKLSLLRINSPKNNKRMPNPNPPPQLHPGNTGKETISQTPSSTTVDEPAAASAGTASVEDVQGDSSVADTSTSLQDIVSSIPADIQDPFETVCKHFVASLRHPFRLHDHIAVHLSDKLLLYITEKKFSEWPVADKASFLTALLPRKRMNEQLRPAAEKVFEPRWEDDVP